MPAVCTAGIMPTFVPLASCRHLYRWHHAGMLASSQLLGIRSTSIILVFFMRL
jgi:hypothetical protein